MEENTTPQPQSPAPVAAAAPAERRPLWRRRGVLIGVGAAAVVLLGGAGAAYAFDEFGDDDRDTVAVQQVASTDAPQATDSRDSDDVPLTSDEFDRASAAALAEADGGRVTDVDRDDDAGNAYDVDVLLDNGDELEIELDADFRVTYTELDPRD
ncbi:PepSY domain-containing protein [Agromyces atrinae]|uniref:Putative membrane protein YkoI n=1 Tax=Agromyces atrinae TaxID=592376 RepID=A0A4Q2MCZ3_9MICO|nr:hypothetical protein [Agromyces atrinae]NYD67909.1 putative membrane protein YkoI [Agromyces atrinae]RXZ87922.1 hypothetical protein ESP50_01630 [Agromyces atrinae]